jgi:alpha-galactosidase
LIEKYCTYGSGWNPGAHAYILNEYQKTETTWEETLRERASEEVMDDALLRGQEYAAYIANALVGGEAFLFNGNVQNKNLVTNLPQDACVEVPVYVDENGLHPVHVGALPPECALLTNLSSAIEEMVVQAAFHGDPIAVYRAICHDPLTASVLSLREIKAMVNDLFAIHKDYLPQFKHYSI